MANLDLIGEFMPREYRADFKVLPQVVLEALGHALKNFSFKDNGAVNGRTTWRACRSRGGLLVIYTDTHRLDLLMPSNSMDYDQPSNTVTVETDDPPLRGWVSVRDDLETHEEISF